MIVRELLFVIVLPFVLHLWSPKIVNSDWVPWGSWQDCSITCGEGGFRTRIRSCIEDGSACIGDGFVGEECSMEPCPVDGVWFDWSPWSNCTLPCGSETQFRYRTCQDPLHGGLPCQGDHQESNDCNLSPCPVDGNWTEFTDWRACPVSCGGSTQTRNRTCIGPFHGGNPCPGSELESADCNVDPCPIDGAWSEWTGWSDCSVTCNHGQQVRRRSCDSPPPQHGGDSCAGRGLEDATCFPLPCPQDGGWSLWSQWFTCSQSCGWGVHQRQRACTNPTPAFGGYDCIGSETGGESCLVVPCPVDAGWSQWSEWSSCSRSCGSGGNHTRARSCDYPPALHGGSECAGTAWEMEDCYVDRCEDDGGWTMWSNWYPCSKDCETGIQHRNRTCDNPVPTPSVGEECRGPSNESRPCNTHVCPVHGGWSAWVEWSLCPVTCGGDHEYRHRACTNPPPLFNGDDCPEWDSEERACSINGCPVDGAWTAWTSWTDCSTSCGGGNTSRSRTCTDPATAWGGIPCPEVDPSLEWNDCNMFLCPIPGLWSGWSPWSDCPVTCGGYELSRVRQCDDPPPQHDGEECVGAGVDTYMCNAEPCAVNGSWTEWSSWTDCSRTCEGGVQTRTRTCTDPAPAHGGAHCPGNWTLPSEESASPTEQDEAEERGCNSQRCPINGGFDDWTDWPLCPVSCGGASIYRYRNCTNPAPMYGGLDCPGGNTSHMICNGNVQCPIHGEWGRWLNWAPCSKLCENGTTSRIRLCNNPSALYGGDHCVGDMKESAVCNVHRCPVHGGYSPWSTWSQCTKSCGGGQTQRTRDCTNPAPLHDGNPCIGPTMERRLCSAFYCPVDGGFSPWGEWMPCPVACGGAVVNRTRSCSNPAPRHGGRPCEGPTDSSDVCATNPCPVDGSWTSWLAWSQCSASCDSGYEVTSRNCSDPPTAYGGARCPGEGYRRVQCYNVIQCPVLPPTPTNVTFSVTITKASLVSIYIMWDTLDVDGATTDYFKVQAKLVGTQSFDSNTTAYEWATYGTVMGVHRGLPVRQRREIDAEVFKADISVRVIAGNRHGETISPEYPLNVVKFLVGGASHTAVRVSLILKLALVLFVSFSNEN